MIILCNHDNRSFWLYQPRCFLYECINVSASCLYNRSWVFIRLHWFQWSQVTFWRALFRHVCNLTLLVWCRGDGIDLCPPLTTWHYSRVMTELNRELTVGLYPRWQFKDSLSCDDKPKAFWTVKDRSLAW